MHKELTELQNKFLDALFGPAKGNHAKAMKIAGYADATNPHHILDRVGLAKVEKMNVTSDKPIGVFILPAKTDDSTEIESD